jgi:hypothetical protein
MLKSSLIFMNWLHQHRKLDNYEMLKACPASRIGRKFVEQMKSTGLLLLFVLILDLPAFLPARGESAQSVVVHLPQRVLAFTIGAAVGTPVALVRCTRRELIKQTKEAFNLGGVPKPFGYITAGAFGIPSGVLYGAGYGTADGVADSLLNAKDAPYSKDSFSLEKLAF